MKLSDKQWAFLQDIGRLIRWASENGYKLTEGEGERLQFAQCVYYHLGYSKKHEHGAHGKRLAHDFNVWDRTGFIDYKEPDHQAIRERMSPLVKYWEGLDPKNIWGGNWDFFDAGHFERME